MLFCSLVVCVLLSQLVDRFVAGHLDEATSDDAIERTALEVAFVLDAVARSAPDALLPADAAQLLVNNNTQHQSPTDVSPALVADATTPLALLGDDEPWLRARLLMGYGETIAMIVS